MPIEDKTHKGRGSGTVKVSDTEQETQNTAVYSQPYDSVKTRVENSPGFDQSLYNSLIGLKN